MAVFSFYIKHGSTTQWPITKHQQLKKNTDNNHQTSRDCVSLRVPSATLLRELEHYHCHPLGHHICLTIFGMSSSIVDAKVMEYQEPIKKIKVKLVPKEFDFHSWRHT
jgi:hypothetical protein